MNIILDFNIIKIGKKYPFRPYRYGDTMGILAVSSALSKISTTLWDHDFFDNCII